MATDLCTIICAVASYEAQPPADWVQAVVKEAQFQLQEFMSDFSPNDLARLISGNVSMGLKAGGGCVEVGNLFCELFQN